jgi:hypothetical protein
MKMFLVVYSEATDESITEAFKKSGFTAYTKMHGVTGEGRETEPKLGTHFWPGRNNALFLAVPDEQIQNLCELVKKLRLAEPHAGLRAFTFPLEECI